MPGPLFRGWWQPGKRMFFVVSKMDTWGNILSPVYLFSSAWEEILYPRGEYLEVLYRLSSPASGGGEVEGKGRLQAVAQVGARGGEAKEEGLGLFHQLQ